ncbi:MAG TPA: hypothetical protein VKV02_06725, partial [Acidobacteriaceae bacterium]|nr:hypothetical protein [Acidobacteriaceae bacterium]
MNERPCIRCQHPVQLEDGHLVYCSFCGSPQIFLSEELQDQIAQTARDYADRNAPAAEEGTVSRAGRWGTARLRGSDPKSQAWPTAVQYALISAGIALGLGLLSLLLPPVGVLMLLWAIAAPILTVAFFLARSTGTPPPGSNFPAKLGLLTSMLVATCCAMVFTLQLVMERYVF